MGFNGYGFGNKEDDIVAHDNGEIHEVVDYAWVRNQEEFETKLAMGEYDHFCLATNVEITRPINLASGSSLCLNGFELRIAKGANLLNITDGRHVTITDCTIRKDRGIIYKSNNSFHI